MSQEPTRHPVGQITLEAYSWFNPEFDMQQMRDGFDRMLPEPADDVKIAETTVGGVSGRWAEAPGVGPNVIVHLHGGGFMMGSSKSHREFGGRFSRASGCRVLLLDYRLAPENPYPAALDDVLATYRALIADEGLRPKQIVFTGESAGGGLAVSAAMALRDAGDDLPAGIVTNSPLFDLALTGDSMDCRASIDPLVQREGLELTAQSYLGEGGDRTDPIASPYYGNFEGLPPMLMHWGTSETLEDDSVRVAEKARDAGVEVTAQASYQMTHMYHLFAYDERVPEAQRDIERIGDFVKSVTE